MKTEGNEPITSGRYKVSHRQDERTIRIEEIEFSGLTKREYFAAMAMQGFCANENISKEYSETISAYSVSQADALITALHK